VPGQHHAVAAVVAFAAADADVAGDPQRFENIGATAPGIFHQHQAVHAKFFDGPLINAANLRAAQQQLFNVFKARWRGIRHVCAQPRTKGRIHHRGHRVTEQISSPALCPLDYERSGFAQVTMISRWVAAACSVTDTRSGARLAILLRLSPVACRLSWRVGYMPAQKPPPHCGRPQPPDGGSVVGNEAPRRVECAAGTLNCFSRLFPPHDGHCGTSCPRISNSNASWQARQVYS
jgi:hypothetical protein